MKMRRNYDRHARRDMSERYDKVYVQLPELFGVRRIEARPLKTIYINMAAQPWAESRVFSSVEALERFCQRWRVELP